VGSVVYIGCMVLYVLVCMCVGMVLDRLVISRVRVMQCANCKEKKSEQAQIVDFTINFLLVCGVGLSSSHNNTIDTSARV